MNVTIECDCGAEIRTTDDSDHVRCDACGAQFAISVTRLRPPDEPAIKRIPQPEFYTPVEEITEQLKDELEGVLAVVLYGSVACGDADRRSDIDLWVLVEGNRLEAQRQANGIRQAFEERAFDTGRYEFEIDVETIEAVPNYEDEIREILTGSIVLHSTDRFDALAIRPVKCPSEIRGDLDTSETEDGERTATEMLREERERDKQLEG